MAQISWEHSEAWWRGKGGTQQWEESSVLREVESLPEGHTAHIWAEACIFQMLSLSLTPEAALCWLPNKGVISDLPYILTWNWLSTACASFSSSVTLHLLKLTSPLIGIRKRLQGVGEGERQIWPCPWRWVWGGETGVIWVCLFNCVKYT